MSNGLSDYYECNPAVGTPEWREKVIRESEFSLFRRMNSRRAIEPVGDGWDQFRVRDYAPIVPRRVTEYGRMMWAEDLGLPSYNTPAYFWLGREAE